MVKEFSGKYRFLSNFYIAWVEYDGGKYPTNEHAFQAAKTHDPASKNKIRNALTPGKAKRLGRKVTLRTDWEQVKRQVMYDICLRKFTQNPELLNLLFSTGDQELREGNNWGDTYWGICNATNTGTNHLGKILMKIRGELRHEDV